MPGVVNLNPISILYDEDGNPIGVDENPLSSKENTILEDGSYPDPSVVETGSTDRLYTDSYGNLRIRGPIITDEMSFRDDFDGNALISDSLTGTFCFTNGSVGVSGIDTFFTTELDLDDYVCLPDSLPTALERINYIIDDTHLELLEPYNGITGSGNASKSKWHIETTGGASYTVGSSKCNLISNTTSGNMACIWREGDYLPFVVQFQLTMSQRISNQETKIGVENDTINPTESAVIVFQGTDNRKIICRTRGGPDSIQETTIILSGGITTESLNTYEIDVLPSSVTFLINGFSAATHKLHIPKPYTQLSLVAAITNTGTATSSTTVAVDQMFWQNCDQIQVGSVFSGEPLPVQGVVNGMPMNVQFGVPGGPTLPKIVDLAVDKYDGAIVANAYKNVLTYEIPAGYTCYLIKFTSFQGEFGKSRCVTYTYMGTLNIATNAYVAGSSYATPQWSSIIQSDVTTQLSTGSGNVVVTVGYTNESNVAGRTGTITISKGSLVGTRNDLVLQSGDLGVSSIQSLSVSPTLAAGSIRVIGIINLATHQDQSTTTQTETMFAPGSITMPTGTTMGLEYAGGTVSKARNLDVLVQLVILIG